MKIYLKYQKCIINIKNKKLKNLLKNKKKIKILFQKN
jgi:hypothetical protein